MYGPCCPSRIASKASLRFFLRLTRAGFRAFAPSELKGYSPEDRPEGACWNGPNPSPSRAEDVFDLRIGRRCAPHPAIRELGRGEPLRYRDGQLLGSFRDQSRGQNKPPAIRARREFFPAPSVLPFFLPAFLPSFEAKLMKLDQRVERLERPPSAPPGTEPIRLPFCVEVRRIEEPFG